MKQIASSYTYSPTTNVVTLTSVNIDQDQLLLIVAPQVGRTMYNFASVTGTVLAGASTRVTLNASTAGLTTTSPLIIFYDDQASTQAIAGSVTANLSSTNLNAVTIGIRGTVTANNFTKQNIIVSGISDNYGNPSGQYEYIGDYKWSKVGWNTGDNAGIQYDIFKTDGEWNLHINSLAPPEAYTVSTAPLGENWAYPPQTGWSAASSGTFFVFSGTPVVEVAPLAISGTVTVGNSITIGSIPAISGTVTVGNSVTIGSLPAISGTVTAAAPNGSLTTRFGTPTTANVSFATSAVTNANRKYLLIQNVTTGSNVITVGIGFTPTTTQGIQLTAGAGITFESSYIPTGAVHVLSSVTASNFTILEA